MYRFWLASVPILTCMENMDTEILVTCTGLNNCKKVDINGTREDILATTIHKEDKLGTFDKCIQLDKHRSCGLLKHSRASKYLIQLSHGVNS